jgi:hypothetical protein
MICEIITNVPTKGLLDSKTLKNTVENSASLQNLSVGRRVLSPSFSLLKVCLQNERGKLELEAKDLRQLLFRRVQEVVC